MPGQPTRCPPARHQPGTGTLTSYSDAGCFHTQSACDGAIQRWQITIQVQPTAALLDSLARGWNLNDVHPFEEGDLPRKLWCVDQVKPRARHPTR